MHTNVKSALCYIHYMLSTSSGHTCGHSEGGSVQWIYYKTSWINVRIKAAKFYNAWFEIKIKIYNTDKIFVVNSM